ncbi:MAG: purine-nucleoside phosphorylase [Clostridia bacterium]|nr:purine-nucleoside phosphorylase [Clostridia bacterium]
MSDNYIQRLENAYKSLTEKVNFSPDILLVLGSGLGDIADEMQVETVVEYRDIDGMPISTVDGHKGRLVFGYIRGAKVVVMQGRLHYYEGYTPQECIMPIRLAALMGAKVMFLTNASGGITYPEIGDLMRITDHISLVPSPLRGENYPKLGKRFPDMSKPYDEELGNIVDGVAKELNIDLKKGVYIQFQGPNFETASEIRMAKTLGADAVGMSSAIEVIGARHAGMRVVGLACIVNPACGITDITLDNVNESEGVAKSADKIRNILFNSIERIKEVL